MDYPSKIILFLFAVFAVHAGYHSHKCNVALELIQQNKFNEATEILELWSCDTAQTEYLIKVPYSTEFKKLKNQEITVRHLLNNKWSHKDLIRAGYDPYAIANTVECRSETFNYCVELSDELPISRKIIKIAPLDQLFKFCNTYTLSDCIYRCLDFDLNDCLYHLQSVESKSKSTLLLTASIQRKYDAAAIYALEAGGSYTVDWYNEDFLERVSIQMKPSMAKYNLLEAIQSYENTKLLLLMDDDDDDW